MNFFLDPDMAYLLGLIVGRGTIREISGKRQLIIEYPFKNLIAKGINKAFQTKDKILLSLDETINRLGELIEITPKKVSNKNSVSIIIESNRYGILWRNIDRLLLNQRSFREMGIPHILFRASEDIKKEFIRGVADVTGSISTSCRYRDGRHRIYISILNDNWKLPIQICNLLQSHPLYIPVNTIDWGHPNTRNGNLRDYHRGAKQVWAREHQLKVFAEYFEKIGFRIIHKDEILKELAEENRRNFPKRRPSLCKPPKKRIKQHEPHPEEMSEKLPIELRGKHYNAYWQICLKLGCTQGENKFFKEG